MAGTISTHSTTPSTVLLTPKWVRTQCQPIAVADVLDYLAAALEVGSTDSTRNHEFEIGGT